MDDIVARDEMRAGDGWWDRGYRCIDWQSEFGDTIVSCTRDQHTFDTVRTDRESAKRDAANEITKRLAALMGS